MHRRLDIIIALLFCIALLLVLMLATGCTTARGLHSNNIGRNAAAKCAMQTDKDYKFVR